jgi:hypothetical protein
MTNYVKRPTDSVCKPAPDEQNTVAPGPHEPHLGLVCEKHLPEKSSCISCDTLPTPCDGGGLWETVNCGRCGNRFANHGHPDDYGGDIPSEWVWNAAGCPPNGTAGAGSDWGYEGFSTREGEHYLCARCIMASADAVYGEMDWVDEPEGTENYID